MRTTLNLSANALETARRYAAARSVNLGDAVSHLIEQAATRQLAIREVDGVWVADLGANAKPVSAELVEALMQE